MLLPTYATHGLPSQVTFTHPGAGPQQPFLLAWRLQFFEALKTGRTEEALTLLQKRALTPDAPLALHATSSESGRTVHLPFSLAALLTSKTPAKTLHTLTALRHKGYTWSTVCTLDNAPLPWEVACAMTWMALRHALMGNTESVTVRRNRLQIALKKACPEKEKIHRTPRTPEKKGDFFVQSIWSEAQAFVVSQGGSCDVLQASSSFAPTLALGMLVCPLTNPHVLASFLKACAPSQKESESAWTTPSPDTPVPLATLLAARLTAYIDLKHTDPLIHAIPQEGTYTQGSLVTPRDLLRLWRLSWKDPCLSRQERTALQKVLLPATTLLKNTFTQAWQVNSIVPAALGEGETLSRLIDEWCTLPGGEALRAQMDVLCPLPSCPLPTGELVEYPLLKPSSPLVKPIRHAFTRHTGLCKKLASKHVPLALLRNPTLLRFPALLPLTMDTLRLEEDPSSFSAHSPSSSEASLLVPADELLSVWHSWVKSIPPPSHAPHHNPYLKGTTHLVTLLQTFERHEGAPFTFRVGEDTRRWTVHGYLWARGTQKGIDMSRALVETGYPLTGTGFYYQERLSDEEQKKQILSISEEQDEQEASVTDAQEEHASSCQEGQKDSKASLSEEQEGMPWITRPFEACFLLHGAEHFTHMTRKPQKTGGRRDMEEVAVSTSDLFARREEDLRALGFVPDWTCRDTRGAPLEHILLEEHELKSVPLFLTLLRERGVQPHITPSLMAHLQKRLVETYDITQRSYAGRRFVLASEIANVQALTPVLEQALLDTELKQARLGTECAPSPSRSKRPRL